MENHINMGDQNAQQAKQGPVSQPSQLPNKPKTNCWMISTVVLIVLLLLIMVALIINLERITNSRPSPESTPRGNNNESIISTPQQTITPTPASRENLIPAPEPGFKQYLDENLRYGFSYQDSLSLSKCADIPCASIDAISLRINPLEAFHLAEPDPKASLLAGDLYCDAGGPMENIECKNTKVEDFTNLLGFGGFKIYRTKTVTRGDEEIPAEVFQDIAYVFPLEKVANGRGLTNFAGILFAVDTTTKSNLSSLEEIVNSFFSF